MPFPEDNRRATVPPTIGIDLFDSFEENLSLGLVIAKRERWDIEHPACRYAYENNPLKTLTYHAGVAWLHIDPPLPHSQRYRLLEVDTVLVGFRIADSEYTERHEDADHACSPFMTSLSAIREVRSTGSILELRISG